MTNSLSNLALREVVGNWGTRLAIIPGDIITPFERLLHYVLQILGVVAIATEGVA
ncbi:hypothetical protein ACFLVX_03750 [Chloroflexota bacterium]